MREKMDLEKSMKNITGMLMKKRIGTICTVVVAFVLALNLTGCGSKTEETAVPETVPQQEADIPIDETSANADTTTQDVPQDADTDKMVSISVENLGRSNPFVPLGESASQTASIPQDRLKYDLPEPLETPSADPGAQKVVTTKVSGIMYDKNNPSAILNIDGADYLVRSGDVINGYKVLSISKSVVTVQMGRNIYKAGVGQLVDSGQGSVNYNTVANLSDKFGGAKK